MLSKDCFVPYESDFQNFYLCFSSIDILRKHSPPPPPPLSSWVMSCWLEIYFPVLRILYFLLFRPKNVINP